MQTELQERTSPRIATTIRHFNGLHDVVYRKPEHVYSVIERHFDVSRVDLLSDRRNHHLVKARHWGMYLMKTQWRMSYPYVGRLFGDRDHTTVMYGVGKITEELATSAEAGKTLVELVAALQREELENAAMITLRKETPSPLPYAAGETLAGSAHICAGCAARHGGEAQQGLQSTTWDGACDCCGRPDAKSVSKVRNWNWPKGRPVAGGAR